MKEHLWNKDIEELKALYVQHSQNLNHAILQGVDWGSLEEQRKLVSELSKVIDMKREGMNQDPSRVNLRKAK